MGDRLLHAGDSGRDDTVNHRRADDLHTGIALLSDDGGKTGRSGQVAEETEKLRRSGF